MTQSYSRLLFPFVFTLLISSLSGQSSYPAHFTPHGPGGGGYMYSPSISPFDPNQIFLVCDMGGMYHSKDGGQTWTMQDTKDFVSTVKGKVQFSSDPNILYAVSRSTSNLNDPLLRGELAKSTDAGTTWQTMTDPTESGVHSLEVDPGSTQRLIINEYNQLYFSANGGNSWISVYHPSDDQMWLGGVFWDGQNIYVGTNHGLLVSKNGGASFAIENHSGLPAVTGIYHLAGAKSGTTTRLFCIPATASEMYAWLDPLSFDGLRQGVFRMNYTANASWVNTRGNIPTNVDIGWVDLAKNNTQIVWTEAADPDGYTLTYKSVNGGQSWASVYQTDGNQNISTGWTGSDGAYWLQQNIVALGLDVSDNDPNYAIRTRATVEITNDGGATWRSAYVLQNYLNPIGQPTPINKFYKSSGLDVTSSHQIFWANDQETYLCNTDIGLTYSADAGDSWTFARNTFFDYGPVANNNWYRIVERPDNHQLFAAVTELNDLYLDYRIADAEIEGDGGLVVTSTNGGATWDTLHNFGHPVIWLEIDKNDPARMWASVVHHTDGGIFRTTDGGQTWAKLNAPPRTEGHPYNIISLADGGLVVTYSARKLDDGSLTESSGVFFSPDGGNTWLDRTAPAMRFYTKDLAVDPHDPTGNTWYSTVWGRSSTWPGPNNQENGGLYKTTNRGQSWTRIFSKSPSDQTESITVHPSIPGTAYLTVENDGLYFTHNLDAATPTFERVTTYPWWRPKRVFFNPNDDREVWVASMGGGVWKGISSSVGTVVYSPSNEDFANPERGFMQFTETSSSNYSPLNPTDLAFWRTLNQPSGADYAIYSTLGYRGFYLESFLNGPISNAYLNAMQQDFAAARQAGVKLVLRFAYTHKDTPPYGDAPKNIVLQHIAQLKPILQANADVIAVLNMGFIGTWGEGYYTDYFGDDSQPPYGLTAQNWDDRTEVLNALLDAIPADRSVQVRIPQMKQKAVYGAAAPTNAAPLTTQEAWQVTAKARIGFHNDCFLSGDDDQGTYKNYDTGVSGSDTAVFKPYFANDSRFVPVGGETCVDWDPYSNCNGPSGGLAQKEMARMHYSFLNSGWNNAVNNDWVSGGCIEEIKQRLGYRLELQNGEYPTTGSPGQAISIKIELKNTGFAAPFNPRKVRLLMRNVATNAVWDFDLPDDPRSWLPGNQIYTIDQTISLPTNMPLGNYELLLHLADPYPSLTNRPEYAIRLANENTWEAATGFNRLQHQMTVVCIPPDVQIWNPSFLQICQGDSDILWVAAGNFTTYTWYKNGIEIPGAHGDSLIVTDPTGVYKVYCTDVLGCSNFSQDISFLLIPLPPAKISALSPEVCIGAPVTLLGSGGSIYQWLLPNGDVVFNQVIDIPSASLSDAGLYQLTVTNNGCSATATFFLPVNPLPTVAIQPPSPISLVFGDIVLLDGGAGFASWLWNSGETTPQIIVSDCGEYSVTVKDDHACSATATAVTVSVSPVITFNNGVLNASPAVTYQWLLNGDTIPGATSQTFVPTVSGDYSVQVDCPGAGWASSNVIPVIIVGLSETTLGQLKMYPNPVSDHESKLTLELQGIEPQAYTLLLVDLAGREFLHKLVADFSEKAILETEKIPAGSYFVQVWQVGKMVATSMFLKI